MALTGTDIKLIALDVTKDIDGDVWTDEKLLRYINEGQKTICIIRPDASVEVAVIALVAGVRQEITGRRLIKVLNSNTAANGSSPVSSPHVVEFDDFMRTYGGWMNDTSGTDVIDEYAYDERDPSRFYITPGSDGINRYAEVVQATVPADLAAMTDPISISDIYAPALAEWALYRAFGQDSEYTPNYQRALNHLKNLYSMLGKKGPPDLITSPNVDSMRAFTQPATGA